MKTLNKILSLVLEITKDDNIEKCLSIYCNNMTRIFDNLSFTLNDYSDEKALKNFKININDNITKNIIINKKTDEFLKSETVNNDELDIIDNSLMILKNITDSKIKTADLSKINFQLVETIKKNEALLSNITLTAPMMIYIYDLKLNKNIYANEEIYRVLGLTESSENISEIEKTIIYEEDMPKIINHINKIKNANFKEILEIQYRIIDKNKKLHYILSINTPYKKDENNLTTQILGCAVDITEKNIAIIEKEEILKELEIKNEELENIIYATSHDLRSPLINIQGFTSEITRTINEMVSLIRQNILDQDLIRQIQKMKEVDFQDSINYINQSIIKIDLILKGLLKLSKIGKSKLNLKLNDINHIINNIINEMQYQLKENNTNIIVEKLDECFCDETLINQVITNLLDNAIKYRKKTENNTIKINSTTNEHNIIYCIEDNGVGIRKKDMNKIFELFHKVNIDSIGQGLGLTIVRRIMDKHNGKIRVESAPGEGSKFYLVMPKFNENNLVNH